MCSSNSPAAELGRADELCDPVEGLREPSAPPKEPPPCFVCGEAAVSRCDECSADGDAKLLFCAGPACFKEMHNAFNGAKHHQMLVAWDSVAKWCATHTDKPLEYWCEVCAVPVCAPCCSHGAHVGHTTSLITDVCGTLQNALQEKAAQLRAEVKRGTAHLQQLATLRDEAGSVGAAGRALDEAEKQFAGKMRALRAELEAAAVAWRARVTAEHEALAQTTDDARRWIADSLRAACDGGHGAAQRVAVGHRDLLRRWDELRALQCSLLGCEVMVPAEALAALQKAVADLGVTSDGMVTCTLCGHAVRESAIATCDGCKRSLCESCGAACLACDVKAEKDALPQAERDKAVLPGRASPYCLSAAAAYNALGEVWQRAGNEHEARRVYLKAAGVLEEVAPGSLDLAHAYHGIGVGHQFHRDQRDEALCWFKKARRIQEETAAGSLDLASTLHNSGFVCLYHTDEEDEAQRCFKKACAIREDKAPNSLDLADTYHQYGMSYRDSRRYPDEAQRWSQIWFGKARTIREEQAPNSLDLAHTYHAIGVLAGHQDKPDKQWWFERAEKIRREH